MMVKVHLYEERMSTQIYLNVKRINKLQKVTIKISYLKTTLQRTISDLDFFKPISC